MDDTTVVTKDEDPASTAVRISDLLTEYVGSTQVTFFVYTATKCPVCGKVPTDAVDDYVPIDMQQLFFNLAWKQLGLTRQ